MEIWKDIKDYEGLYQISNLGNVKALEKTRNWNARGKQLQSVLKEKILIPVDSYGYCHIILWKDSKIKNFSIHRLVAQAFIENPKFKSEVNHINAIKNDNRVENLEWVTQQENREHSYRIGIAGIGEKNSSAKLKNYEAEEILKSNEKSIILAKRYNVSITTIRDIKIRKRWKHIKI
jgi:hypothetical protein